MEEDITKPLITNKYHLFVINNLISHRKFKNKTPTLHFVFRIIQMFPEYRDKRLRNRLIYQISSMV